MKARNKQTGEIVEILRYGETGGYTVFKNGLGVEMNLPINFYDNFEVLEETESAIDWEQRRYEIAKEMLPQAAISVNTSRKVWMEGMSNQEASAVLAKRYADALIAELRKEKGVHDQKIKEE